MINVQFITHETSRYSYLDSARMALAGGCKWIQLRMKDSSVEDVMSVGKEVRKLCLENDAKFIIDDYVDLVPLLKADGVHLGKNDMPVSQAREILGKNYIIGGTANTYDDVYRHYKDGVDYIGCGPFRFTTTKKNLSPVLGLEGYSSIFNNMKKDGIKLPVVAIGGIERKDIPEILSTGVDGIALSGTILRADNPVEEMKEILKL